MTIFVLLASVRMKNKGNPLVQLRTKRRSLYNTACILNLKTGRYVIYIQL